MTFNCMKDRVDPDDRIDRRAVLKSVGVCAAAVIGNCSKAQTAQRGGGSSSAMLLKAESFKSYVDYFNGMAPEEVINYIPNSRSWAWMRDNIPYFACPDRHLEETYYYRWWAYRKAIKQTPKGFVLNEFLKPVKHATEYNAISCAFGLHVAEGRWMHDARFLDDYVRFWLKSGENGTLQPKFHQYSGWASYACYDRWLVNQDRAFLLSIEDSLKLDYATWQRDRQTAEGLFWQADVADGMESSISGGRKVKNLRPTINSYMFANAHALSLIASMADNAREAEQYAADAEKLRTLVQEKLWNQEAEFFETVLESGKSADVREQIGFTPWCFDLPDSNAKYCEAWKQLMDTSGFYAPYGLTTAEQRDPRCVIEFSGDDCQWNGPAWPFATSITLRALTNLLNHYKQDIVSKSDYFQTLITYAQSLSLLSPNGQRIPWVDENLDPYTGEWLARERKIQEGTFYGRGNHYNHSTFADGIITGLVGLRPAAGDTVEVNPLLPERKWEWFCLDNVLYHNRILTIVWDRTGTQFACGSGLRVFADGKQIAGSDQLAKVTGKLSPA